MGMSVFQYNFIYTNKCLAYILGSDWKIKGWAKQLKKSIFDKEKAPSVWFKQQLSRRWAIEEGWKN